MTNKIKRAKLINNKRIVSEYSFENIADAFYTRMEVIHDSFYFIESLMSNQTQKAHENLNNFLKSEHKVKKN